MWFVRSVPVPGQVSFYEIFSPIELSMHRDSSDLVEQSSGILPILAPFFTNRRNGCGSASVWVSLLQGDWD